MMKATLVVGWCDTDDDRSPPFHHSVPLLPPASGRRSRRGVGGVTVVSAEGPKPCGRSAVNLGVDLTDGECGGGTGVQRSATDGAGGRRC